MVEEKDVSDSSDDYTKLLDSAEDNHLHVSRDVAYARIHETLQAFQRDGNLDLVDRILLKGFYTNNRNELERPNIMTPMKPDSAAITVLGPNTPADESGKHLNFEAEEVEMRVSGPASVHMTVDHKKSESISNLRESQLLPEINNQKSGGSV